jgi:hypothetical protein
MMAARARPAAWRVAAAMLVGSALACTPGPPSGAGGSTVDAREPSAEAAAPSPSERASPAPAAHHWTGTYRSVAGTFHVPDGGEWSGYRWRGDDAGEGLGEGPLSLTIDPSGRIVTGTAGGAIGDALIDGAADAERVTASLRRKNPSDRGLTGTLVATRRDGGLEGTMRLSFGDGHLLREATFHLAPAPAE